MSFTIIPLLLNIEQTGTTSVVFNLSVTEDIKSVVTRYILIFSPLIKSVLFRILDC